MAFIFQKREKLVSQYVIIEDIMAELLIFPCVIILDKEYPYLVTISQLFEPLPVCVSQYQDN